MEVLHHKYCPFNSWCLYRSENPESFEHKPHHFAIYYRLPAIFENYTQESCLSKMVLGYTTNINESYSLVFCGRSLGSKKKHQKIVVMIALLQYQDGFSSTNLIMQHLKIPVTNYALKTHTDLDKQRKKSREYKKLQENDKRYQSRLSADLSDVASTSLSTSISSISVTPEKMSMSLW